MSITKNIEKLIIAQLLAQTNDRVIIVHAISLNPENGNSLRNDDDDDDDYANIYLSKA